MVKIFGRITSYKKLNVKFYKKKLMISETHFHHKDVGGLLF